MSHQSSPSRSNIEPYEPEASNYDVPDSVLAAARRPSWTLAVPELPEHDPRRTPSSISRSKRRSRIRDEYPWSETPDPGMRRASFEPSTPESSHRARKPRIEVEESDVVAPNIRDSEEGKGFRSSWEINVKKLVGDAVGNVSLVCQCRGVRKVD